MSMRRGLTRFQKRKKDHHGAGGGAYIKGPITLGETLKNLPPFPENNIIYLHIPFCSKICSFCNMRRGLGFPTKEYVETLLLHIKTLGERKELQGLPIDSIYFGGGTPSTLQTEELCQVLDALQDYFPVKETAEISMETSITELTTEKLQAAMEHGLNRISVGIQTFSDEGRKLFQRRGSGDFVRERLAEYKKVGLENINIDLIYNYPGETLEDFEEDLMSFKALDLAGFSLYSLIIMPGSSMERMIAKENLSEEERFIRDMDFFQKALEVRDREGWEQMELTKIVQPGRDEYKYIRHRLAQGWTLPIGAGAGGNIGSMAMMGPILLDDYKTMVHHLMEAKGMDFTEIYYKRKAIINPLQLGYLWKKDLEGEGALLKDEIESLLQEGYFVEEKDRYRLTDLGLFWGNSISAKLWELFPEPEQKGQGNPMGHPKGMPMGHPGGIPKGNGAMPKGHPKHIKK